MAVARDHIVLEAHVQVDLHPHAPVHVEGDKIIALARVEEASVLATATTWRQNLVVLALVNCRQCQCQCHWLGVPAGTPCRSGEAPYDIHWSDAQAELAQ